MALPEIMQQVGVSNAFRIIIDLNRLRVIAEMMIGWMIAFPARVPHPGADNAFNDPEPGVRPPKSPESEGGGFKASWRLCVDKRELQRLTNANSL